MSACICNVGVCENKSITLSEMKLPLSYRHHHRHQCPSDLLVVGHCLDVGTCSYQSHISGRNLGRQLSM